MFFPQIYPFFSKELKSKCNLNIIFFWEMLPSYAENPMFLVLQTQTLTFQILPIP